MRRAIVLCGACWLSCLVGGCGGGTSSWDTGGARRSASLSAGDGPHEMNALAVGTLGTTGGGEAGYAGGDTAGERTAQAAPVSLLVPAETTPYRPGGEPMAQADEDAESRTAHDGYEGPLRIYSAFLQMAVHRVNEQEDRVEEIARELGGHLDRRVDNSIRIRVPAARFDEALHRIQEMGDVRSRRVEVQDVTEEFHDVNLRIQTLEAMRARVEQLLRDADDVEEALAVEQHLERITLELESLRGRIRYLADRVAFSTIEVSFQEQTSSQEPQFVLPFQWLQNLGLETLMTL